MPRFTILPAGQTCPSAEITSLDARVVLNIVGQLACEEADVLKDGRYSFSLALNSNGLWSIFQRAPAAV